MPGADALGAIADLPGVRDACAAALARVDELSWDRALRSRTGEVAAESALRGARASAAIDGADVPLARLRDGSAFDDSPMGRALAAAWAVTLDVPRQVETWSRAPAQVLARLHAVAAAGFEDAETLGRPRTGPVADDPLRLGIPPDAAVVAPRLVAIAEASTGTEAPALVAAAIAHSELLTLRPFRWGSGLVARAVVRLVLAARGVDPALVTVPEAGVLAGGRPAYVTAVRGYASGTPHGVADWVRWHADAVSRGVDEARAALAALG